MREFFQLANIGQDEWNVYKRSCRSAYLQDEEMLVCVFQRPGDLDKDIVKNTKELMKEYSFEKDIKIINASGAYHSPAFCTEHYVYLDAEMLRGLGSGQIASIVLHELGHIKFGDTYNKYCMEKMFWSQDCYNSRFISRYSKFCEQRADAYSSLADPKYARALASVFQTWVQTQGDHASPTHPKHSERVYAAHRVLEQLGLGTMGYC